MEQLYRSWRGGELKRSTLLPKSGSNRQYFRVEGSTGGAILTVNDNLEENRAFVVLSRQLRENGIRVPEIYAVDLERGMYLQEDLGATSLFDVILAEKSTGAAWTERLSELYDKVLIELGKIREVGVDFSICYPRMAFDEESMSWDLQYFKYYFLKLAGIDFNEQRLEDDFGTFKEFLLRADCGKFMYRDFQSRNIMIRDGEPWFIDYQGGRRGAAEYDVASLLFDAKAEIPVAERLRLLERAGLVNEDYFWGYALIRIMQAMGAYGYRGFFEKKSHFLKSIPPAQANLLYIISNHWPGIDAPELKRVLQAVGISEKLREIGNSLRLKVNVSSFSYRHAIPVDNTGNGGGYVFDCRALPNPGRNEKYRFLTGKDAEVAAFFEKYRAEMDEFLDSTKALVAFSVRNYMERGFRNLAVNFGCTGGQHRSVYCAEAMARWLRENFDVEVTLKHWEQKD